MPGVYNLSVDQAVREAEEARSLGVPALILFGLPETKDEAASGAWEDNGIVQQAARALKREVPEMLLVGDVCLCEYMSHGHCGVVRPTGPQSVGAAVANPPAAATEYEILNDATLELLTRTSVSLAKAGIDIIAPSDMMDGRVGAIRKGLDGAGFEMPYLDVISAARERFDLPLAAYQVSGEYAMIEAAARNHWIDRERVMMESLVSIRRAGASIILTYYAKEAAKILG
jgi:porphobilinogen synthase